MTTPNQGTLCRNYLSKVLRNKDAEYEVSACNEAWGSGEDRGTAGMTATGSQREKKAEVASEGSANKQGSSRSSRYFSSTHRGTEHERGAAASYRNGQG